MSGVAHRGGDLRSYLSSVACFLTLILAGRVTAQTFAVLHNFSATSSDSYTNWDGAQPYQTGLVLSGTSLYGTTLYGGVNGRGTVFSVNTNGNDFTVLHTFSASQSPDYTNLDGEYPQGGLVLLGGTLYGTTLNGGTNSGGYGTLFSVGTNGTGFTAIQSFDSIPNGSNPNGGLVVSGNKIYGTTQESGATNGFGTVFSVNTDGTGLEVLHTFTVTTTNYPYANEDGGEPDSGLILSGDTLYGTAQFIGPYANGTIFSIKTNGADFTVLHTFTAGIGPYNTNADGAFPRAALVLSCGTLYGTASFGGDYDKGVLFSVSTNGSDFKVLHAFTDLDGGRFNLDGAFPTAPLLLLGNTLYGTANVGGVGGNGTVFSLNTGGSGFTVLHSFAATSFGTNSDGMYPECTLALSGNTLYGTTEQGGAYGNGTVFSLFIPPQLTIIPSGPDVILTWPTNYAGFTLQSTTNLGPSAVWTTNSAGPLVVNGQNTVTNPISGPQQFYRLSQ